MKKQPIRLGRERGFCAGVRGALARFEETLRDFGAPLYVLDELVHNRAVTENMKARGAVFVDSLDQVPDDATLLFGAHGVPPETILSAKNRHICFVDATCPLVRQLQKAAAAISPERDLILFGDPAHPEMKGVAASAGTRKIHFVSRLEDVNAIDRNLTRPLLLSQTTRNEKEIRAVAGKLKEFFPQLEDHAGVCNAVMARQQAVRELAKNCGIILIAGSPHSSNALRLKEIASNCGAKSYLIENIEDLPTEELRAAETVGVSSGASTPEGSLRKIVDVLLTMGFPAPEESR